MIRHSGVALTALLAAFLLWAPLPFGGVTSWGEASMQVLAFCALALAMAAIERPTDLRPAALPAAALAGVALIGLLQALPLPAAVVSLLSPEHARLHGQAAALLGTAAAGPARLSLAPAATFGAALTWAAAAACLLAGAAAGRRRYRRRWLGGAVVAGALVQIFFGARNANAGERTLWGVEVPIAASRLRGTFFNPNHLAVYLEIALALVFAWGWWAARRARAELALDRRVLSFAPPALVWLTLFAGLTFTASRGGLAAALVGILVQGVLLATVQRRWAPAMLGAAAAVAGIAAALAMGLQAGPARMLATMPFDVSLGARRQAWSATWALWKSFPITGTGLGTFRDAFTLQQPAGLDGTWWHAHSGPLELLATAGLAGPLLLGAGLAALVVRLIAVLRRGRRSEDRAAGLAVLGALAAVGVHEWFDFGLTLPANALTLAILAGAASSARLGSAPPAPPGGNTGGRGPGSGPAGVRTRQADGAGKHGAAGDGLDLEKVKPRRKRSVKRQDGPGRDGEGP
ncbi:MAG TPA: O-antigen ligase family protein [Thermoanaerobaculia bacterium]|nr:O-antigen ligase family protein [Thermoanaerobaculia bacterium]